ncbi:uncharacterized protein RB166_018610 [Leptodactylus fuscus]
MNTTDSDFCRDCEQRAIGSLIFHELYCYDFYVVSAPHPQNQKQSQVDMEMNEKIVKPLEKCGFKCYLGSRNTSGGELIIQALSKPMTIIPTTIVPVYKDRHFSELRNFLIRPDYLDRIVFVCFDSTPIEPRVVSKNSYSLSFRDPHLLSKLIRTNQNQSAQTPLSYRKTKYEQSKMCSDPQSTISSTQSDFHRNSPFRRSDLSRLSFRVRPIPMSVISEASRSAAFVEGLTTLDGNISVEKARKLTSPDELLSCCHNPNENIRTCAAERLRKLIQQNLVNFCRDDHLQLETFEKQTRNLIEKNDSITYMKLYFWILAAIFFRIYKYNCSYLKRYMKTLIITKYKVSQNPFDRLCQQTYFNLATSLHATITAWPNKLDSNNLYIKKFEACFAIIDMKSPDKERKPSETLIKNLTSLPEDMKHIFTVAIAEKLFQKNYDPLNVSLFSEITYVIGRKHWSVFIEVLESLTEYILGNYTEGSLQSCMRLLFIIIIWTLQRRRRKKNPLNIVLKHFLRKLVYHPVSLVRHYVAPLIFGEDFTSFDISQLSRSSVKVNEAIVEMCVQEHMHYTYPELILDDEVPIRSLHTSVYKARTPEGDALVYVFKQRTLNDVLLTNSADGAYKRFCEMSRLVQACQVHENIVARRKVSRNSVLPFFVVENGEPLLQFLHAKENQLTWFQMIDILIDITTAVHHCHSNNIILCDITPASFIIVPTKDGSYKTKLATFLHARGEVIDSSSTDGDYIEDSNFLCIQGDSNENIPPYFSSPESLSNKTFSKYTEAWMLAATFYSVLLYGRQPFEELTHLNVFHYVNEIVSNHTASKPMSIPLDLWNIVKTNLDFSITNRILTETVLEELKTFQKNLEMGYLDDTGRFILEEDTEELPESDVQVDSVILRDQHLVQTVTTRMDLNTKRKISQLDHENILKVDDIKTDLYKTVLVSKAFNGHVYTLSRICEDISRDQLFTYFKQITLGLQELHKHNIVHCDLRCSHIYVNPHTGTLKIGHIGRAVSFDDTSTFPYAIKLMPADAKKWSAPEVRNKGMYSKLSDIFSLGAVFWEAVSLHINAVYQNQPLEPFQSCKMHLEEYFQSVNFRDERENSINKLIKCILTCWNPNPIKRPSVNAILDALEEIMHNAQSCPTAGETPEDTVQADEDEESQSDVYEMVFDYEFSINYAWKDVVNELKDNHGFPRYTKPFIELIETSTYEDIGIPLRSRRRSKQGFIL